MRFRLIKREKCPEKHSSVPIAPAASAASVPRAADLENPYGRYYGVARSLEQLKRP